MMTTKRIDFFKGARRDFEFCGAEAMAENC